MGVSKIRVSGAREVKNQRWGELSEVNGSIYVAWKTCEQALALYPGRGRSEGRSSLGWSGGDWGAQRVVTGSQQSGKNHSETRAPQ